MRYAKMLEGNVRGTGVHACGTIICRDDITDWVPVSTADDKETGEKMLVTQYEGSVIEDTGLIKMDFLGLKTLSIIKDAVENIRLTKGSEDRHRRFHDHRRPGDLQALLRGPHRRNVPVRVRRHAEIPARVAAVDLRGPDRHERPLSSGPDGLHPGFHRPQARPQARSSTIFR